MHLSFVYFYRLVYITMSLGFFNLTWVTLVYSLVGGVHLSQNADSVWQGILNVPFEENIHSFCTNLVLNLISANFKCLH